MKTSRVSSPEMKTVMRSMNLVCLAPYLGPDCKKRQERAYIPSDPDLREWSREPNRDAVLQKSHLEKNQHLKVWWKFEIFLWKTTKPEMKWTIWIISELAEINTAVYTAVQANKDNGVICRILHVFSACSMRCRDIRVQWKSAERKKEHRVARN